MMSKVLAFSLIAAGCVVAAAGGAYVAVRQNAAPEAVEMAATPPASPEVGAQQPAAQPVSETEAVVAKPAAQPAPPAPIAEVPVAEARPQVLRAPRAAATRPGGQGAGKARTSGVGAGNGRQPEPAVAETHAHPAAERAVADVTVPAAVPAVETAPEPQRPQEPPPAPLPEYEEVTLPAGAVIGLQVSTPLSSERTQVEDRVEARVTRDVTAGGRVAIPAGSRAIGAVTVVERGGKMKERARLGVRFHTLVLANGIELPLRTDAIFREGQSPTGESARKIGGAAVGGAILGAILGGGKGAAIGGATGAAGGTAVVMAGDRNAAVLSAGETVTVRLTSPVSVEVRKEK